MVIIQLTALFPRAREWKGNELSYALHSKDRSPLGIDRILMYHFLSPIDSKLMAVFDCDEYVLYTKEGVGCPRVRVFP